MTVRRLCMMFVVCFLVTGCVTAEKFSELERKVQRLETLSQTFKDFAYEPQCGHPGKKQKTECSYRLKVSNIDRINHEADGSIPDDVIDFHNAECKAHTNDLPQGYPCPEYEDYRGLKFHFKIDPFPTDDTLNDNQTHNFMNNRNQRSLRLDEDQRAPSAMKASQ